MTRQVISSKPFTIGSLFETLKHNSMGILGMETFLNGLSSALDPLISPTPNPIIDKKTAYLIRDQKGELPKTLKIATNSSESVAILAAYYKEQLYSRIPKNVWSEVRYHILQSIENDTILSPEKKKEFQHSAREDSLAYFLARCTLFVIARKNCVLRTVDAEGQSHKKKYPLSSSLPIPPLPDIIQKREKVVLQSLLNVYGEQDQVTYALTQIGDIPRWNEHLSCQRQAFQSIFPLKEQMKHLEGALYPHPFEQLCNEMKIGIYPTYTKPHASGYHCLCDVLERAMILPLDAVPAIQRTNWIGSYQRMGLCHYLIYQKQLHGWMPSSESPLLKKAL